MAPVLHVAGGPAFADEVKFAYVAHSSEEAPCSLRVELAQFGSLRAGDRLMSLNEGENHLFLLDLVETSGAHVLRLFAKLAVEGGGKMVGSALSVTAGFSNP